MKRAFLATLLVVLLGVSPAATLAEVVDIDSATNQVRAEYGLPALPSSAGLAAVAAIRAQQASVSFSHPDSYQWIFDYLPGCESLIGENLAYYTSGAEPAGWPVSAWMASPLHRANILGTWSWQGSAMLYSGDRTYAVQIFALACQAGAPPPVPPVIPDTSMLGGD